MALGDLVFLVSVLLLVGLIVGIAVAAIGRRRTWTRWLARTLVAGVLVYAALLVAFAVIVPRRVYAVGTRRCFDDWCVATGTISPDAVASGIATDCGDAAASGRSAPAAGGARWRTVLTVSSVARRVRQRAPDAHVELEDEAGRRYAPCTLARANGAAMLTDALGPGEVIAVPVVFQLPPRAVPAGLILHHGDVPGVVIIGSEQSVLHPPSLMQLAVVPAR
jgi:hypothetical protein